MNVLGILGAVRLAPEGCARTVRGSRCFSSLGPKDEILNSCSHGMKKFPTYFKPFWSFRTFFFFFFFTKPIGMFLEGLGIQDVGWVSGCGTPVYPVVL